MLSQVYIYTIHTNTIPECKEKLLLLLHTSIHPHLQNYRWKKKKKKESILLVDFAAETRKNKI
jgi:hypothetical protein